VHGGIPLVMPDTGLPGEDAASDFGRMRRRRVLSVLAARLRFEPDDVNVILPFDEVVAALGQRGERDLGLQLVAIDTIVGSVDRTRDFDRSFRPTSPNARERWQRIATAVRRGEAMPPIDLYRIGELHFVRDGHHRVSVARAMHQPTIEAYVTEIITEVGASREIRPGDLALKSHERLFFERVPLPLEVRDRIQPRTGTAYAQLAEGVEAWGMRAMQARGVFMTREDVARAWFEEEYQPVVQMLAEVGLTSEGSETDAYMAVVTLRYLLLRTHRWDEAVLEAVREQMQQPAWEDTEVKRLRRTFR
jgi:hypothetical protein